MRRFALFLALAAASSACSSETSPRLATAPRSDVSRTGSKARVQALRAREGALRSQFSPREQPPWIDVSGADPYRIVARDAGGYVGILRGSKALVVLDAELGEVSRVALPEAPTALCVTPSTAFVASRYASEIWRIELGASPRQLESWRVESGGVADLACSGDGPVYALLAEASALVTLGARGQVLGRRAGLPGGLRVLRRGNYLLVSSLFERALTGFELDARGLAGRELFAIHHQGPIWAFDALQRGSELFVAASGVEDKPLVREHGEFENIDSFVWLYRYKANLEQLQAIDVSEHGLVVPKAVSLGQSDSQLELTALGAGSGRVLRARLAAADPGAPAELVVGPAPPGASDVAVGGDGFVYPSPLLDAWVRLGHAGATLRRVDPETRPDPEQRLGEALFFTELMAPDNSSAGSHSRFSCETCHFEGGVDGRLHYTGRADVSVVTKPLFGLANNRPHFSRALDPDLSSVCHNEFRVAGAGSGTDPWFTLPVARFAWLHELGIDAGQRSPLELRSALLSFLYGFTPAPNPQVRGRSRFSPLEAEGAQAFREHCSGCHAARLVSDDASTETSFDQWEQLVLRRNAPLVWARGEYAKTGVLPYVNERGTRITSLRRLHLKPRYFTSGAAPSLEAVLQSFRQGPDGALHLSPSTDGSLVPLAPATQRALLAFLQLL